MKTILKKTRIAVLCMGFSTIGFAGGTHKGGHSQKDKDHHGGGHKMHGSHGGMHGSGQFDKGMKPILKSYESIQKALLEGNLKGVTSAADSIITDAKKLQPGKVTGEHANHYKHVPMNLVKSAEKIKSAKTIEEAREIFKKMSQPMAMWTGMAKPEGYEVKYCPMVKASWVQSKGKAKNPYYGKGHKMEACGETI